MNQSLEIELISAEGLKKNRKPIERKTFCVVKIDQKTKRSSLYEFGGNNPIWNDKIEMEIPVNGFIFIEVFYRTGGGSDKSIGNAKIPVKDFLGGFAPRGYLNFLSYRLRDEYGDKSGIVNVSIMVKSDGGDKFSASSRSLAVAPVGYGACSSQAAAVTNGQMWRSRISSSMAATSGYGGGRVVTGVPVWCAYQRPS